MCHPASTGRAERAERATWRLTWRDVLRGAQAHAGVEGVAGWLAGWHEESGCLPASRVFAQSEPTWPVSLSYVSRRVDWPWRRAAPRTYCCFSAHGVSAGRDVPTHGACCIVHEIAKCDERIRDSGIVCGVEAQWHIEGRRLAA